MQKQINPQKYVLYLTFDINLTKLTAIISWNTNNSVGKIIDSQNIEYLMRLKYNGEIKYRNLHKNNAE